MGGHNSEESDYGCVLCGSNLESRGNASKNKNERNLRSRNKNSFNSICSKSEDRENGRDSLFNALRTLRKLVSDKRRDENGKSDFDARLISAKIKLFSCGHCCCNECSDALLELLRLQEVIEETKQRQDEVLEAIKLTLKIDPGRAEDVKAEDDDADSRASRLSFSSTDDEGGDVRSLGSGIDLRRISPNDSFELVPEENTQCEDVIPSFGNFLEEPPLKRFRKGTRQHTRAKEKEKVKSKTEADDRTTKLLKTLNIKECSVVLERLKNQGKLSVDSNLKGTRKVLRKPEVISRSGDANIKTLDIFYKINDEILLLRCTLIKTSPTGFTCGEPGCSIFIEGTDFFAFDRVKCHVAQTHVPNYESGSTSTCPLCEKSFATGRIFRRHLLAQHTTISPEDIKRNYRTVVCECCWRPLRYADYFKHIWRHKNDNEIIKAIQRGDVTPTNIKRSPHVKKIFGEFKTPGRRIKQKIKKKEGASIKSKKLKDTISPVENFYKLKDGLLVHAGVLIEYSRDGLVCQSGNCKSQVTGLALKSFKVLRKHIKNFHRLETAICVDCPICSKNFTEQAKLKEHIAVDHSPPVISTSSWKLFKKQEDLSKHFISHRSKRETVKNLKIKNSNKHLKRDASACVSASVKTGPTPVSVALVAVAIEKMPALSIDDETENQDKTTLGFDRVTERKTKTVFFIVNKDMLLLLCTPIKLEGTRLKCLESGCSHVVIGSGYYALEEMKSHVVTKHEDSYYSELHRPCPICDKEFSKAKDLRLHLFREHFNNGVECQFVSCLVLCESCGRSTQYGSYYYHIWRHKSSEDVEAAVSNGEKIPPKYLKYLKEKVETVTSGSDTASTVVERLGADVVKKVISLSKLRKPLSFGKKRSVQKKKRASRGTARKRPTENRNITEVFMQLRDGLLCHDGILIEYSAHEFVCKEGYCGTQIRGLDYESFKVLQEHVKFNHGREGEIEVERHCPLCNTSFQEIASFKDHIVKEHSPPAICTICWKPFQNHEEIYYHMISHRSVSEAELPKIKKIYPRLPVRVKINGKYCCESCPREFNTVYGLRAHEVRHIPLEFRERFRCSDCGREFLSKVALRLHVDDRHRPDLVKKRRECPICGKKFPYRQTESYNVHMRTHSGETPWICEICGKGFNANEKYKIHKRTVHTTERPFQCEFCEMNYKHPKNLNRHRKTAHKELIPEKDPAMISKYVLPEYRPGFIGPRIAYPCEYCDKVFQLRSRMTKHVKAVHSSKE